MECGHFSPNILLHKGLMQISNTRSATKSQSEIYLVMQSKMECALPLDKNRIRNVMLNNSGLLT